MCCVHQDGNTTFHVAGEDGVYDLQFWFDPRVDVFDPLPFTDTLNRINAMIPVDYPSRARAHIGPCEDSHCCPLLKRLLLGESPRDVFA